MLSEREAVGEGGAWREMLSICQYCSWYAKRCDSAIGSVIASARTTISENASAYEGQRGKSLEGPVKKKPCQTTGRT